MSDASQADAELVQRIRAGDTDAWGELISRYEGRLLAFAESRLRNRDVALFVSIAEFYGIESVHSLYVMVSDILKVPARGGISRYTGLPFWMVYCWSA